MYLRVTQDLIKLIVFFSKICGSIAVAYSVLMRVKM